METGSWQSHLEERVRIRFCSFYFCFTVNYVCYLLSSFLSDPHSVLLFLLLCPGILTFICWVTQVSCLLAEFGMFISSSPSLIVVLVDARCYGDDLSFTAQHLLKDSCYIALFSSSYNRFGEGLPCCC